MKISPGINAGSVDSVPSGFLRTAIHFTADLSEKRLIFGYMPNISKPGMLKEELKYCPDYAAKMAITSITVTS